MGTTVLEMLTYIEAVYKQEKILLSELQKQYIDRMRYRSLDPLIHMTRVSSREFYQGGKLRPNNEKWAWPNEN